MSFDGECEETSRGTSLYEVLETRQDLLTADEIWAILKETCVAFKCQNIDFTRIILNIHWLFIDTNGNIQVQVPDEMQNEHLPSQGMNFFTSLAETMLFIINKYSKIDPNDDLCCFMNELINRNFTEQLNLYKIESHADRRINSSSADILTLTPIENDEVYSDLQESFLSTENSLITNESDTDRSLTPSKSLASASNYSLEKSLTCSDDNSGYVSLNQLWNYCYDPIIYSDQECLILLYMLFRKISNALLNETSLTNCICLSTYNIFISPNGKILLNFSSTICWKCNQNSLSMKYYDIKCINIMGEIMNDVIQKDYRVKLSNHILLMLNRMQNSTDLIINDILYFCKSQQAFHGVRCRSIIISLFQRWSYWWSLHLESSLKLKHQYLYDISTMDLQRQLRKTVPKEPFDVKDIYQQNPSLLKDLEYVVFNKETFQNITNEPYDDRKSAFHPYKSGTWSYRENSKRTKSTRPKTDIHFRPLILMSETSTFTNSQDALMSPIGVSVQYSRHSMNMELNESLTHNKWNSMDHMKTLNKSSENLNELKKNVKVLSTSLKSIKLNTIIEIIHSTILNSLELPGNVNERQVLAIADFALSLETLTEFIFVEAMKQRFSYIPWTHQSLKLLFDVINNTDGMNKIVVTPKSIALSENKDSGDEKSEDFSFPSLSRLPIRSTPAPKHEGKLMINNSDDSSSIDVVNEGMISPDNTVTTSPVTFESVEADCDSINDQGSSDIDLPPKPFRRRKQIKILPKKQLIVKHELMVAIPSEDASFYENIYSTTLLSFPATMTFFSQYIPVPDTLTSSKTVQTTLENVYKLSQTIQLKFRELIKANDLISKCLHKTEKKLGKQFRLDYEDIQLNLESLILSQLKLEMSVVEYHSVNSKVILEEIISYSSDQSIVFSKQTKCFQNLQVIKPSALVACLFSRGAVSSGLLYEFLLVYREFYTPIQFVSELYNVFTSIEKRLKNPPILSTKSRMRLLFILLCWIDGFYDVDFDDQVIAFLWNLVSNKLSPYVKNVNVILEKSLTAAKFNNISLSFQFTTLKKGFHLANDIIRKVDIQRFIETLEKNDKVKRKNRGDAIEFIQKHSYMGSQDTFTIFELSPKELAICLTLIEQEAFNEIHPCHIWQYLKSLTASSDSILNTMKSHRFFERNVSKHRRIFSVLRVSGKITHWIMSEILRSIDAKLQAKIIKKFILTCRWCVDLNNYSTFSNIIEALNSTTIKSISSWSHIKQKTMRNFQDLELLSNKLLSDFSTVESKFVFKALLRGNPVLPSIHTVIVKLKFTSIGNCFSNDGSLKWTKLKKISDVLDQIRLFKQFYYSTSNTSVTSLKEKLLERIEHLTSVSLDTIQSQNLPSRKF